MSLKNLLMPIVVAATITAAGAANAATFVAKLTGDQEVAGAPPGPFTPAPTGSEAVGYGVIETLGGGLIDVTLDVVGLTIGDLATNFLVGDLANLGPVHLHNAPAGANGPIEVAFPAFGIGDGIEYGVTSDGFNLVATGVAAPDSFFTALEAGNIYFNVHSNAFPGGEIRGQVSAVPVPASGMLLGGVMAFGAWRTRKAKKAA